jgi:hypothetical protein
MRENIVMTRGDSRDLERTLYQAGIPMDLIGTEITFTVKDLFAKTLDNGIELVPPDSGTEPGMIAITIDPADTEDVPDYRKVYRYDIEVDDGGTITTPLYGDFIVIPDVTE